MSFSGYEDRPNESTSLNVSYVYILPLPYSHHPKESKSKDSGGGAKTSESDAKAQIDRLTQISAIYQTQCKSVTATKEEYYDRCVSLEQRLENEINDKRDIYEEIQREHQKVLDAKQRRIEELERRLREMEQEKESECTKLSAACTQEQEATTKLEAVTQELQRRINGMGHQYSCMLKHTFDDLRSRLQETRLDTSDTDKVELTAGLAERLEKFGLGELVQG